MTAAELWKQYTGTSDGEYEAWAFGGAPDSLADLVIRGIKTATASLYYWYEDGSEPLPKAGEYSVILNAKEEAVCIIQTTDVSILPFCDVTAEQAFLEGEGDKSLKYWQDVHREFFSNELKDAPLSFSEDMCIVFERFKLVYPPCPLSQS